MKDIFLFCRTHIIAEKQLLLFVSDKGQRGRPEVPAKVDVDHVNALFVDYRFDKTNRGKVNFFVTGQTEILNLVLPEKIFDLGVGLANGIYLAPGLLQLHH